MRESRAEIEINGHTYIVVCEARWGSIEMIHEELVEMLYSWTHEFEDFGPADMLGLIDSITFAVQMDHLEGLVEAFKERGLIPDPDPD